MLPSTRVLMVSMFLMLVASGSPVYAQQPLETETARPLKAGVLELQTTFEYQTSTEGTERAAPSGFEYGITDRLSLLAEPIFYTGINPKVGRKATGLGDFEATLSYLVSHERSRLPAVAIAAEIKAPTARDLLIGTGKSDFAAYVFASKRFGKLDTHTNIGYTFVGKPLGATAASDIVNVAFAGEYAVRKKLEILGEVLSNTSSGGGEGSASNPNPTTSSELAGGELVGMIGFRYHLTPRLAVALGANCDNNRAVLLRMGMTFRFNSQGRKRSPSG